MVEALCKGIASPSLSHPLGLTNFGASFIRRIMSGVSFRIMPFLAVLLRLSSRWSSVTTDSLVRDRRVAIRRGHGVEFASASAPPFASFLILSA